MRYVIEFEEGLGVNVQATKPEETLKTMYWVRIYEAPDKGWPRKNQKPLIVLADETEQAAAEQLGYWVKGGKRTPEQLRAGAQS